jgi:hypothetical protein
MRIVIPEASLWEPASPFLYQGPVELWQEGRLSDEVWVSHGLRTLTLSPRGLRINSRAFTVHGVPRHELAEGEARALRAGGYNTVLASLGAAEDSLWDEADRLGFLVLARLDGSEASLRRAKALATRACCFAWVVDQETAGVAAVTAIARLLSSARQGPFLGVEVRELQATTVAAAAGFVLCPERRLNDFSGSRLPILALTDGKAPGAAPDDENRVAATCFGSISTG